MAGKKRRQGRKEHPGVCGPRKEGQMGLDWPRNIGEGVQAGGRRRAEQLSVFG